MEGRWQGTTGNTRPEDDLTRRLLRPAPCLQPQGAARSVSERVHLYALRMKVWVLANGRVMQQLTFPKTAALLGAYTTRSLQLQRAAQWFPEYSELCSHHHTQS